MYYMMPGRCTAVAKRSERALSPPVEQAHVPDWHSVPGGHALSQPPQWLLSDCRSAHCQVATSVPHSCRPAGMQSGSTEVGMDGTE